MTVHVPPPAAESVWSRTRPPRISIVTPSYNQGRFIEETIRSVLQQGYPELEYIIVDGGSTDATLEIIRRYEPWLHCWVSEPDAGQSDALNKGFRMATGDIYFWLNSDDVLSSGALWAVAEFWTTHQPCHFVTGDGELFNSDTGRLEFYMQGGPHSVSDLLMFHKNKYLPQPSVFFSSEAYTRAGGIDVDLHLAMDLDLWIRIRHYYPLFHLPMCLSRLRSHPQAKTVLQADRSAEEVRQVVGRYVSRLTALQRLEIRLGLRLMQASFLARRGLQDYFAGDTQSALRTCVAAARIQPGVLLTRPGLKLWLRLILPGPLKRHIFDRP